MKIKIECTEQQAYLIKWALQETVYYKTLANTDYMLEDHMDMIQKLNTLNEECPFEADEIIITLNKGD